jgi:ABC-type multidrug transport system fused ATPase/permease subunit
MLEIYQKLIGLFDATERRRGLAVLLLLVLVAFIETLGVASIMPFIAVLSNPDAIQTNTYLQAIYSGLSFTSERSFLIFLGASFFVVLLLSLALRALGLWAQMRFSHNREWRWSERLVSRYLHQPYEWFLSRHSSDLATAVLSEVNQVVTGALFPAMQVVAHVLVSIFLLVLLVSADPLLAFTMGGALIGSYVVISWLLKRPLGAIGRERKEANRRRFHAVQEAFGGIKDVKLGGHEDSILEQFSKPSELLAKRRITTGILSELPSFVMQGLLFGGMLLVLLHLIVSKGGFQSALPLLALYAFGGYRLMPAIQTIYRNVSIIRTNKPALDALHSDFSMPTLTPESGVATSDHDSRIAANQDIELVDVSYTYPGAPTPSLRSLSMRVQARTTVGLVGPTGSGKTTTVDLLLGLLRPTSGALQVDGVAIYDQDVRRWQRSIGYVPQHIFLSDDSIAANIAFGVSPNAIDMQAVERAAIAANLHEFVVSDLPNGYFTQVGERGVRLSGGQRQRIGIARALYHDPEVLILDEATSALDNLTEQAVMDAVKNLGNRKTIILIAHRLSTVRGCDCIFLLERGQISAFGKYDELVNCSEAFRRMAELN